MDDAHSALLIIIFIVVLFINFSIHSFNSAINELNSSDIGEDKSGERLKYYLENSDRVLYCMYIINALSGIFIGWFFVRSFTYGIRDLLSNLLPETISIAISIFIVLLLFCIFFVIFGISIPNKLAKKSAKESACIFMNISSALIFLLIPIIYIVDGISYIILKIFGVDIKAQPDTVSEEDIMSMVNEGHEQGIFEGSEAEMITNIFELNDKQARDVMTHRKNVVFINGEDSLQTAIDFMLSSGKNSRYPVYDENIDNIMGILNMKDALICENTTNYQNTAIKDIPNILRPITFVPENKGLDTLFKEMQSQKNHMVVVVDEYGQTSGIVTMEDILEEIVGNIMDEYDEDEELVKELSNGSFIIKGMTPLSDIEDILDIKFDEEELENFDTINGLMISELDRIPEDNEKFDIIMHGYEFKALHVSNKMINTIKVTKLKEDELTAN